MNALAPSRRPRALRCRTLYPDWRGDQPWHLFILEELLQARGESRFPTNGRGADEDVNVYLADLLARHLHRTAWAAVRSGGSATFGPEPAGPRGSRCDRWRADGDHRLLCLGLFGRGDLHRRRRIPFGFTEEEVHRRDVADGSTCYAQAAAALPEASGGREGLRLVLRKLSEGFEDYVHVLQTLARRRWGLGARLSEREMADLWQVE